jgi:hypothetical protein
MREFNLLSIATIHQHIAPVVEAHLSALGFIEQKPLHWICSAGAPIRQMFRYGQLKGGALAPQWGFLWISFPTSQAERSNGTGPISPHFLMPSSMDKETN